jgi:hypothetical protein
MSSIKAYTMQNSAILRINSDKESIDVYPWYQRQSDIWTLEKKQLLIDSILNEFDIPKLYFHVLPKTQQRNNYDYAVIDGRQRLESIWAYMNDEFPLSDDFEYFIDDEVDARGLSYSDLALKYPRLKIRFDSFTLPIVCVETDDIDLIEDMFSRLNEAVPLSAAEKRNAIGGPMAKSIRDTSTHDFFSEKVKFGNKRYQHREVAARLLFIEYSQHFRKKIIDTKKPYIDHMVKQYKEGKATDLRKIENTTTKILDLLNSRFIRNDPVLRSQSTIPILYLVMKNAVKNGEIEKFSRSKLTVFFNSLSDNRRIAEKNLAEANFELLEFDRMSQQGTNDAVSIDERSRILTKYLRIGNFIDFLKNLDEEEQKESLEELLEEAGYDIVNDEVVGSAIAETNATGYNVEQYEINDIEIGDDEVTVSFNFYLSGHQDPDKPHGGDAIHGEALAIIDGERNLSTEVLSAEVNRDWT